MTNWLEFKMQNPYKEDFFLTKFNSEVEFRIELNKYETNYYQKFYHRGSYLIKNNDQLLKQFKYSEINFYCKNGINTDLRMKQVKILTRIECNVLLMQSLSMITSKTFHIIPLRTQSSH